MEELHKLQRDVPYGYWSLWVEPAWRALTEWLRDRRLPPDGLEQLSAPR